LENALGGEEGGNSFVTRFSSPNFAAHGNDPRYFGAPPQTHWEKTGTAAIAVLDSAESRAFISAAELRHETFGKRQLAYSHLRTTAIRAVAERALELAVTLEVAKILGVSNEGPSVQTLHAPEVSGPRTFSYALTESPSQPLPRDPVWIAEAYGPQGVTAEGLAVIPDASNPQRVTVTVEQTVLSDVVLFASYKSESGGLVLARPIRVTFIEPSGAILESIELEPTSLTLAPQETLAPVIWATYSDGTRLRRWVTGAELAVSSSALEVIDVTDPFRWLAVSEGTATITVTYADKTAQSQLTVVDPFPLRTYQQWKEAVFLPAELTEPQISGDTADGDGDALTTFFEYITGDDPHEPDAAHRLRVEIEELEGASKPILIARLSSTITGYDVTVEQSSLLSSYGAVLGQNPSPPFHLFPGSPRRAVRSQVRANAQWRSTVLNETCMASAISGIDIPTK